MKAYEIIAHGNLKSFDMYEIKTRELKNVKVISGGSYRMYLVQVESDSPVDAFKIGFELIKTAYKEANKSCVK